MSFLPNVRQGIWFTGQGASAESLRFPRKDSLRETGPNNWLAGALLFDALALFQTHYPYSAMPKRTYQPSKKKRAKNHGFRARSKSKGGKKVLKNRRKKGRKNLSSSSKDGKHR